MDGAGCWRCEDEWDGRELEDRGSAQRRRGHLLRQCRDGGRPSPTHTRAKKRKLRAGVNTEGGEGVIQDMEFCGGGMG